MYIYILKCGPGLLFLGLNWPSVQVEFDMPAVEHSVSELRKLGIASFQFPSRSQISRH
jgi:hypothetical protein